MLRRPRGLTAAGAVVVLTAGGCTGDGQEAPVGHTHSGPRISLPVGDGTRAEEVGYRLDDVRLPSRAGRTGEVSFRIDTFRGTPLTDYLPEQTRDLHLYVVREDLEVFRHLHPTMAGDGSWTAPVDLPSAGRYRVIAEFVAEDEGGDGDHVILGRAVDVPEGGTGEGDPRDPVVQVEVSQEPAVGPNGELRLRVRDAAGRPVRLGTWLGAYGHVTGFQRETGEMLHLHPLLAPDVTEAGSELTFHSEIERAGDYRLFVQVRVDGYLHTVPVELTVAAQA